MLLSIMTAFLFLMPMQDAKVAKDVFDGLKMGDRISVELNNNRFFRGTILKLDQQEVTIDISQEYAAREGSLTLKKGDIKEVKTMKALEKEEIERILRERKRLQAKLKKEVAAINAQWESQTKEAKEKREENKTKKEEKKKETQYEKTMNAAKQLGKGLELLQKFPVKDGWGQQKLLQLTTQFIRTKVPLSKENKEFVDNYDAWKLAKEYVDKNLKPEEGKESEKKSSSGSKGTPK